jgi:hypothetical protein
LIQINAKAAIADHKIKMALSGPVQGRCQERGPIR